MEQLIDIYQISGRTKQAGNLAEMVFDEYRQHEGQGWKIDLEYARFSADRGRNLNEALIRIKKEYQRRPNHIEVND